jgi:hypothetical protein
MIAKEWGMYNPARSGLAATSAEAQDTSGNKNVWLLLSIAMEDGFLKSAGAPKRTYGQCWEGWVYQQCCGRRSVAMYLLRGT